MFISGNTIRLHVMGENDLILKVKWINDPQVHAHLHYEIPMGLAKTELWYQNAISNDTRRDFVIQTLDGKPIGLIGLMDINLKDSKAEIYIVIGDKEYWGKGVMAEAESLLIQWAFETFNLHKIWGQTRCSNVASIVTMKKLGFQIEGIFRQEKYVGGERVDIFRLGLLREDFKSSHKQSKI
jgi:RimJ/RimL family protein N-acetyltransferase